MWMVEPEILCRKHLLGEHVETHMFKGSIQRKKNINGFINNNLLEPMSLLDRHEQLKQEMINRGYNHNSPLVDDYDLEYLPDSVLYYEIDKESALKDLIKRCPECNKNYIERNSI